MDDNHYDQLEVRDPGQRELAQFNLLPDLVRDAMTHAPGWTAHLEGVDAASVTSRAALTKLPVLRKSTLKDLQAKNPPYGGFTTSSVGALARIFMSPGPIFEPEGYGEDWWRSARCSPPASARATSYTTRSPITSPRAAGSSMPARGRWVARSSPPAPAIPSNSST
jgi:phenylacetate-CoA ligase